MPIDVLINHKREPNVKDFEIPVINTSPTPFDPNRDIPERYIRNDLDYLEDLSLYQLFSLKLLFPNLMPADGELSEMLFKNKEKRLNDFANSDDGKGKGFDYLEAMAIAKVLFPNHYKSISPELDSYELAAKQLLDRIATGVVKQTENLQEFATFVFASSILFPNPIEKERLDEVWEKADKKSLLEEIENLCKGPFDGEDLRDIAITALVFPKARELLTGKLDWNFLKNSVLLYNFYQGFYLTVLAAEKTEITESGVNFSMPRNLQRVHSEPLPEERSF